MSWMDGIKKASTGRPPNKRPPVITNTKVPNKMPRLALESTSGGGDENRHLIRFRPTLNVEDADDRSNEGDAAAALDAWMDDVKPTLDELKPLLEAKPSLDVKPMVDEKTSLDVKPLVDTQLLSDTKPPLVDIKPPLAEINQNIIDVLSQNSQKSQPLQKGAKKAQAPKKKTQKGKKKNGADGEDGESDDENAMRNPKVFDDKAEDHMGVVETYADYKPAKLDYGKPHPDPVVESATLSSITPTDIHYELKIPKKTIEKGALSALQLESIIYASQAHEHTLEDGETRAGFLIGDGAGVGKGRTVAGIIYENFLRGREKAIWVSVSNDLKYDAERDLEDIGAKGIEVYHLNKFKYAKIDSSTNGGVDTGVIFSTYSSLISGTKSAKAKYNTRLKQLVDWFGADFDGCIVFDECHKAKHLIPSGGAKPTKTGMHVLELQNALPRARVVYASATGASEPRNMAYMVRLGLWGQGTPFRNFSEFLSAVEKRGISSMEVVAMDMKLRGMYIARQLSFKGVTFTVDEVPFSDDFQQTYNDSVELWVEAKKCFSEAELLLEENRKIAHMMWAQFWSAHQRFFKYLCIAAKVSHTVELSKKAIEDGKCVVIGLQSTGEARTLDAIERDDGELTEFVSTAKSVFEIMIENHFPAPARGFLDDYQNSEQQESSQKSPSPEKKRRSNLKRRVLAGLELRPRKKLQVIYSDDSNNEVDEKKSAKSSKPPKLVSKNRSVLYSDSESDVEMAEAKKPVKAEKSGKLRRRVKPSTDSDISDISDSDSRASGDDHSDKKSANESGSESGSSSEYDSDASGSVNNSDDITTPEESDASTIGSDDSGDESSEYDSDISMESMVRGRNGISSKPKTMQEKIQRILMGMSGKHAERMRAYCKRACDLKDGLLEQIESLGKRLPPNTLDQLIDELGGSDEVAEMTGRKGRVVQLDDNEIQYETRAEQGVSLERLNLLEKQRFMDGDKLIAIISEAASNGISLQSDRRVPNQRRRVHITLELPWSADRAIQQFGRSHRSNQVNAPEYVFLISNLAGERRFASSVSKRLESLGALTHADRRATETRNLSQFNVDNKYGREALKTVMESILLDAEMKHMEDKEKVELFMEIRAALHGVGIGEDPIAKIDMARFLNRILGMPVRLQNQLFEYFTHTLDDIIEREKDAGRFDMGIMDMGNTNNAEKIRSMRFIRRHATGTAPIEITTVAVNRGISWEEAIEKFGKAKNEFEGFYLTHYRKNSSVSLFLMTDGEIKNEDLAYMRPREIFFNAYRPHTGTQTRTVPLNEMQRGTKLCDLEKAKDYWERHYESSARICSHVYWAGRCFNRKAGFDCDEGMRRRKYTVLSGSIFAFWNHIEHQLRRREFPESPRIVRLKTTDGSKIVGVLLPNECVSDIIEILHENSENFEESVYLE
ncbi:protein strawberry notch-like [Sitodiplosis mosellana]|uniref:protein strawberry notch-like n=1 Tax=Sitodiplosis mosellana TaxID=263140 RepID=UPI002444FFDB|nr:protein strawberry notch-like [Sitodiplosis mosellana]